MSSDLTMTIAQFVYACSYAHLPPAAIANAKMSLLDTLGVMLAGSQHEAGRIVAEYAQAMDARGSSTIVGRPIVTSPELAALANGVVAHALDYDDHGHASTQSLPAALALAEAADATGADLLLAYILGREVCLHLSEPFDRGGWEGSGPKGQGWHSVGIMGSIGATASAAKIMGLTPSVICTAFGIASSLSGGLFANRGTMTKPLHAGNAARNGVLAATLAGKGFSADQTILTAAGGLTEAFRLPPECDLSQGVAALCDHFHIVKHGLKIKAYPSCSPTHRYIEALRLLMSKHELTPENVESISCTPSKSLLHLYPRTDLECKFSAAFSLTATLIEGGVTLSNCTAEFLKRDDVQALLARTSYVEDGGTGGFIRVMTMSGEAYEQPLVPPRDLHNPEDIKDKFFACAVPVVGDERARTIEAMVSDLEELPSVRNLTVLLSNQ